jgi:hypothetical protein
MSDLIERRGMAAPIRVVLSREGRDIAGGTFVLASARDLANEATDQGPSHLSGQTQPLGLLQLDCGDTPQGPVLAIRFPSGREYDCRLLGASGDPRFHRIRVFGSLDNEL